MSTNISVDNTVLTLNGTVISGFSDDTDALSIPTIEIAAEKYGADGTMIAVNTGTKGGRVTIKLLATTESNKFLNALAEQQKAGTSVVFSGTIYSTTTGASVALTNGVLISYTPFPTLGKGQIGNIDYVIAFESINGNLSSADFST